MAANRDLGTLKYETNLRSVWPDEPGDFTPWLAENIKVLGDALHMDIEVDGTEIAVGAFSVDLVGREIGTDRVVIIENQLTRTDHGHLGQLLAYAAGLDAKIIVWVASEVRDEHREAIHWLNSQTDEAIGFFAVEVELLRIDESRPAARLNVVAQPSDFQRKIVRGARRDRSERDVAYQQFFEDLFLRLEASHRGLATGIRRIGFQSGKTFSVAGLPSGFWLGVWFSGSNEFWVEIWIDLDAREKTKAAFDQLHEQAEGIEAELGGSLMWERKDNTKGSRVTWRRPGSIGSSEAELEEFKQWAVDLLPKFRDVFAPRIAALDLEALALAATTQEAAP